MKALKRRIIHRLQRLSPWAVGVIAGFAGYLGIMGVIYLFEMSP
jgi:hypothetical protein